MINLTIYHVGNYFLFVSNRKGKIIILYDWTITGKIEGKLQEADEMSDGTFEIKNFSFENDIGDIEVSAATLIISQLLLHSEFTHNYPRLHVGIQCEGI